MLRHEDIEWVWQGFAGDVFHELMAVNRDAGTAKADAHRELFDRFLDRLPKELVFERDLLCSCLWRSPERWELAHEA